MCRSRPRRPRSSLRTRASGASPYNDPVGHCTIGYGHLLHQGNCTQVDRNKWGTWTQAEAKGWLQQDADRLVNGIKPSIATTPLHQHEFDALASWAYNLGYGGFAGSGLDIQLSKSPPNYGAVPGELLKWVNANGVKLCGLYRRRTNEGKLFSTSSYAIVTVTCPSGYR
ncbi:MAG: lysozyme [Kineosporiaceae bacterium]|nr:lysozyme [Kineosporiaceae bacterium]